MFRCLVGVFLFLYRFGRNINILGTSRYLLIHKTGNYSNQIIVVGNHKSYFMAVLFNPEALATGLFCLLFPYPTGLTL